MLLGSLHNYRLFLIRHRFTERTPGSDAQRLTLVGHGIAGFGAGLTRCGVRCVVTVCLLTSALAARSSRRLWSI